MKTLTIEQRKSNTASAFALLKQGGQAVANDFGQLINDFWYVDKRDCKMLANWLEQAKRFPRIQAAARKLLPMHCGVKVEKAKGGAYTVTNLELNKKAKAKLMAECGRYKALQLTSLLNHPNIKVKVDFEWKKETAVTQFKRQVNQMLEHGMKPTELLAMIEVAIKADEKAKKDNQKVVELAPTEAKEVSLEEGLKQAATA